jgi:hypothetical protein
MKKLTQEITLDEMEAEIKREIGMRNSVYPRRIQAGKLKQETADFQILVLKAALALIQGEIKKNSPQKDLF